MTVSVIRPDLFLSRKVAIALVLTVALAAVSSAAHAAHLTTFEQYAGMTYKERRAVRTHTFEIVYGDAVRRNDRTEYECLDRTYISGPKAERLRVLILMTTFRQRYCLKLYVVDLSCQKLQL